MDSRQQQILNIIIKEYIQTGQPVSSGCLVDKYQLDISPATVRGEMAELEKAGYIVQPHTSAGRVPTESAYHWLIRDLSKKSLAKKDIAALEQIQPFEAELSFKETAKRLAQLSGLAVFWASAKHQAAYTGLANLLQQPEFASHPYDISLIIDQLDEIIDNIFDNLSDQPQIMLGADCPFGQFSGAILVRYYFNGQPGLIGILGPIRMDYEKNLGLINYFKNKIAYERPRKNN